MYNVYKNLRLYWFEPVCKIKYKRLPNQFYSFIPCVYVVDRNLNFYARHDRSMHYYYNNMYRKALVLVCLFYVFFVCCYFYFIFCLLMLCYMFSSLYLYSESFVFYQTRKYWSYVCVVDDIDDCIFKLTFFYALLFYVVSCILNTVKWMENGMLEASDAVARFKNI